jgi:signal peptidase II
MKKYLAYILTIIVLIAADQLSKALILSSAVGHGTTITVLPFFNLVLVWNKGVSFGLMNGAAGPWALTGLSLVITVILAVWLARTPHRPLGLALSAVIGGALGNVIDRLRFGAVVDFLDFHAFGWHWPAFNVADSAIVLGIAFVVADGLLFEPKRQTGNKVHDQPGSSS